MGRKPYKQRRNETFSWTYPTHGPYKKPRITDYWCTSAIMTTPVFAAVMPRHRYLSVLRYWHFSDNDQAPNPRDPERDRMWKIRHIIIHFNHKFQEGIQPEREICLDESILLYKGRLLFKQYLPLKRARFGIKIFSLCESLSGYTYFFRVYSGKDAQTYDIALAHMCLEGQRLTISQCT